MSTIKGVQISHSSLNHWREILSKWTDIVDKWCQISLPDRPWWHLEVANAGLISTAAICCGHSSLVESSVPKASGTGRSDLWINFNPQASNLNYKFEEFIELKLSPIINGGINQNKLLQAVKDASAIQWNCRAKIGACLYILKGTGNDNYLNQMVNLVKQTTSPDAMAWIFPDSVRNTPNSKGVFEPGVILVLKIA